MVPGAEEGSIETVFLESGISAVGNGEVALGVVVQACDGSDVAHKVENDLVDEEDDNNDPPDVSEVVLYVNVLAASSGVFFSMASALGEATGNFHQRHSWKE